MAEGMPREERELAAALQTLSTRIDYPSTPQLAERVAHRLSNGARPARTKRELLSRRSLALAALALLIAIAVAVSTPGVRSAVAGWLGVLGIEIRAEQAPASPGPGDEGRLGLGTQTTLSGARRAVSWPIATFHTKGFLKPDAVFVAARSPKGQVSFTFRPRRGLPNAAGTGIGLLLSQFRATLGETIIKKVVSGDTQVKAVRIGDGGYWIAGGAHYIMYVDATGRVRDETARLAANTLVWEQNGMTFRLESALSERAALRLARSVS